jgi:hypothetical protein
MWRRPDLTLFLDLSPATAWRRKQDYPFEVMRETNRVYRQALVGLPGVSVVDAEQTSEAVKAEVVARLRALDAADPGAGAHRRAARLRFRIGKMLMAWAARTTGAGWVATRLVVAGRVWHPYVEEVSVSVRDALRQLRYRYGAGSVRLSRTGVLQFVAGGWVHAVALGPLVAQRLARGFQAWFELRAGPHATLVPYACMRECIGRWTVYRTECLEAARDGDVETVLARLQGPPCENQFDGMPFDGMRQRLAHTLGEDGQRIAGLAVEPEPGPRGLLH